MPRPRAVEAHVYLLKLKSYSAKALSVKLHGARPWHLRKSGGFFCSSERESPRQRPWHQNGRQTLATAVSLWTDSKREAGRCSPNSLCKVCTASRTMLASTTNETLYSEDP